MARRFLRHRLAVFGLACVLLLYALAFLGPLLTPWSYVEQDPHAYLQPPSAQHWFGTTQIGEDVFAQTLRGLQKSLTIGLLVAQPSAAAGAGTSVLVLLVCALIAGLSFWTLVTVGGQVTGATTRSSGEVIRAEGRTVDVRWSAAGAHRTDTVTLGVPAPPVGTRTEVAYDPREPTTVFIPGSTELAAVDRAASGRAFSGLIATIVLITAGWHVISRRRLRRRTGQPRLVRRVRVQSGLMTRSWLELDSTSPGSASPGSASPGSTSQWIPVHFDPILATLPAPASVQMHGDPRRRGLVAAEVGGVWLDPSGPIRATEPRGRRIDSPARPDPDALADTSWRRQLRADAVLLTPAPVVGLLWVYLDGGGPGHLDVRHRTHRHPGPYGGPPYAAATPPETAAFWRQNAVIRGP